MSLEEKKATQQHLELSQIEGDHVFDPAAAESDLVQRAIAAGDAETKLPLRQLVKIYYPAALWSMALSAALIMDGMDTGLVSLKPPLKSRMG